MLIPNDPADLQGGEAARIGMEERPSGRDRGTISAAGSSRIGKSTTAAFGGFTRPFPYHAGLQELVGYTEACPVAEGAAGPNATVER